MEIKEFIQFCINDRVTKSNGTLKQINVFVDAKSRFVQIGGVFYTPDKKEPSHTIFNNFDFIVTGWEHINIENLKEYVGLIDGLDVLCSCRQEK